MPRSALLIAVVHLCLLRPATTLADVPADHPARKLGGDELIRTLVIPNLRTTGETSRVTQVTTTAGRNEERRFRRAAVDADDYRRVEIAYETGTRPIYVDTVDGGDRIQEYRVAPSQPARRMTGDVSASIGGSAFTFRDLHHELDRYRWSPTTDSGGKLQLTGEDGPYPRIIIVLDVAHDRLVIERMSLFDPAGKQVKEVTLSGFVRIGEKVRAQNVRMEAYGADRTRSDDSVVTTLAIDWESVDQAPEFRLEP